MRFSRPVIAAAVWIALAGVAAAECPGTTVLFQDDFDSLQPTWGPESPEFRAELGVLGVSPLAETDFWRANTAGVYDAVDMCATMTTVEGVAPDEAKAGLVFWYVDVNNFYAFELAPNGKASVWRRQRGKWLEQIGWKNAGGAREGDGAQNELRVTTSDTGATFYVNGQQFATIEARPPEKGQQIGVFAASGASGPARFSFDTLRVTKP
jgi:hypothetical protein